MNNMNSMMKQLLETSCKQEHNMQIDTLIEEIVNRTKMIKDCVVYDEDDSLREDRIDFNRILEFVGDKTGYEISCNEVVLDKRQISPKDYLELITKLCYLLSVKYNPQRFVGYISVYDDYVEVRFHTQRTEEAAWLEDDLEKYEMPIMCCD